MLGQSSPSKHNVMLGMKIKHPKSTNYEEDETFDKRPVKRIKLSPPGDDEKLITSPTRDSKLAGRQRVIPDSDGESDPENVEETTTSERKTDLESALPPIKTDKEAIEEYENTRAAEADGTGLETRLNERKWIRGKSSIYVDAFNLALETVLEDESHLFNESEHAVFKDWRELSYEAQYLYVRLFLRKTSSWHRINRLGYHSDIADLYDATEDLQINRTLPPNSEELQVNPGELDPPPNTSLEGSFAFADRSEDCITTLEEASSLLLLDELKTLAKDAKVQGKNKRELLKALRRTSGRQTGLGWSTLKRSETEESMASVDSGQDSRDSTPSRENRDAHFVGKILNETGRCIRLSLPTLKLFERVHLVFYRSTEWTEKSLTTIILARIARWTFPDYIVSRSANIFASRSLLLEFEASVRTQFRIDNILEFNGTPTKDTLDVVLEIFDQVYPRWKALLRVEQEKEDSIYATGEGAYLRRLSPAWVYTRIVHKGAYVLGKFKHHKREHETLLELLSQRLFHTSRRGDWYQRKALLEEHYMYALCANEAEGRNEEAQKKHWKRIALATCEEGLEDRLVHLIYHHDLQKRVTKLEKALKVPKRLQHDFGHVRLAKPVERTFYGTQIVRSDSAATTATSANGSRRNSGTGRRSTKTIWVDPGVDEGAGECSVESMCLSQYRALDYRGYHSEGGILKTLFGYLFFDVLFVYIPNVFQTPYQTCPLDLHTDAFYPSRISEVNARLNEISNGDAGVLIQRIWDEHYKKRTCVIGLDWKFELEDLLSIARSFPPAALSTICKVLAQEYGQRGGGVPDLFLWREADSEEGGEVMFAEVKSENDRLSDTQRLWIDVLSGAGVRVELCNALAKETKIVE